MVQNWRDPIHPGEILGEEMEEIGINASQLAQQLGVAKNRISVVHDFRQNEILR